MKPRRLVRWLVFAVAMSACLAPPAAEAATHWAHVEASVFVRAQPRFGSERLARLTPWTYHARPETVQVLEWTVSERSAWMKVRYPGLGARIGWIPAFALSRPRANRERLVLDRGRRELRLAVGRRTVFRAPVGVGAPGSPTPAGRYYIRERIAPSAPGTIYGALAFGTSAYSPYRTDWPGGGQVGIHGTNQPGLIPGWISNGCVRLRNEDVLALGRRLEVGTPLLIK